MDEEVRRGSDGRRVVVVVRAGDVKNREKAFAAAKFVLEHNASREDVAALFETNVTSIGEAMLILKHATPQELEKVQRGEVSLRNLARQLRARTPKDQRERKKIVFSEKELSLKAFEANVWGELKSALGAIAGMPRPADVAALCRKSAGRSETVDRYLMTAFEWITEFSDEWTKRA